MRVCVFVDGENLRHTINDLFAPTFDRREYLPKGADWAGFYDHIVEQATNGEGARLRTYWYVVENIDCYPWPQAESKRSPDDLDRWEKRHNKLLGNYGIPASGLGRDTRLIEVQDELRDRLNSVRAKFDGYTTLQNGISHKHRSVEFRRSGAIPYNLTNGKWGQEKTVDVNLAVDMVTLQNIYDLAVIVSGDQDYVPAAQAVKDMGKPVVNVAFLARNGKLLPGGARRLNQVTDWSISLEWDAFRKFLNISEAAADAQAGEGMQEQEEVEAA
jgi:uncharacterized LabA/DUF88 family protein